MLWIITKDNASYSIISCNIAEKDGQFQLWVTRPNDKSLKIEESTSEDEIILIKNAIDYAVEKGERCLRLAA